MKNIRRFWADRKAIAYAVCGTTIFVVAVAWLLATKYDYNLFLWLWP